MRKEYNKLIRDRIPELIEGDGHSFEIEIMSETEYRQALLAKLLEESQELAAASTPTDLLQELADLYEVIEAVQKIHGIEPEQLLTVQQERRLQRGGFDKQIKLLWVGDGSVS